MDELTPSAQARQQIIKAVGLSFLVPGAGHLLVGRQIWALVWFLGCQILLFGGFSLAQATQLDYVNFRLSFGGFDTGLMVLIPEMGNFLPTMVAGKLFTSVDFGGQYPELVEWRHLGFLLSGMSGVLAAFAASHAAGLVLSAEHPLQDGKPRINPGSAALATLVIPGFGHWMSGRRFKAVLFAVAILGLFFLGMALGGFADFDRQRHPYYWAGQMLLGFIGWGVSLMSHPLRFREVLAYQDAGLLFTTSAGLFNVIAALDAFFRAEQDWLASAGVKPASDSSKEKAGAKPKTGEIPQ
ncbi:MAG: hypothetical protein DWQ01_03755 [Planctomycetota bacterium]|nr:MAG: hypothetical protein DWQ01_03755 [Planctomycetota bacterium]